MPDIFSEASTKAQLEKLQELPAEQGGIGGVIENGDAGVVGSINKQLGKGTFVQADGSWMQRAGYRVRVWFGWKRNS